MARLTRWDPMRELDGLRRELERVVEDIGETWGIPWARAGFLPGRATGSYPMVRVSDDHDNIYVEALAPGVDPNTLDVSVLGQTLRMQGEKQALSEDIEPGAYHRNERSAGRFARAIELPVPVNKDSVSAEYTQGLLTIILPKADEAKPKSVNIQVQ